MIPLRIRLSQTLSRAPCAVVLRTYRFDGSDNCVGKFRIRAVMKMFLFLWRSSGLEDNGETWSPFNVQVFMGVLCAVMLVVGIVASWLQSGKGLTSVRTF